MNNKLPKEALYINKNTYLEVLITQKIDDNNFIALYKNRFSEPIYFISTKEKLNYTKNTYYQLLHDDFGTITYIDYKTFNNDEIQQLKINPLYIDIEQSLCKNTKYKPIIKKEYNTITSITINNKEYTLNQGVKYFEYYATIIEITNNLNFKIQFPKTKNIIEVPYDLINQNSFE